MVSSITERSQYGLNGIKFWLLKKEGGLGVSSFYALNRALLFKWVWRFCKQQSAFWTKIIKGIHGEDGKIGKHVRSHRLSLWLDIFKEVQHIQRQGTDLMGFIHRKMGNRLQELELKSFNIFSKIMEGITLFDSKDRWRWSLEGCGEFTVASVRNLLDANSLPVVSSKTRWIKAVPIKVNIHAWKVKLDILLKKFTKISTNTI
ncbi:hypothetical protein Tco_1267749 [Tanacetum coccineum]